MTDTHVAWSTEKYVDLPCCWISPCVNVRSIRTQPLVSCLQICSIVDANSRRSLSTSPSSWTIAKSGWVNSCSRMKKRQGTDRLTSHPARSEKRKETLSNNTLCNNSNGCHEDEDTGQQLYHSEVPWQHTHHYNIIAHMPFIAYHVVVV